MRGARQVGCRGDLGPARARAPERHPAHRRARCPAALQRGRHCRDRRRGRTRRGDGDLRRRHRGRLLRRGQQRQAAARLRQRCAPARTGERIRPSRAQLHVPQQPGRAGAVKGREPDDLPEDARAQRLLFLGRRGLRVPAREHPDGRQVAGADVPRREARRDPLRPQLDARGGRPPRRRLLALDRGPASPGEPGHARARRQRRDRLHGRATTSPRIGCSESSRTCSAIWACTTGTSCPITLT